MPTFIMFGKYSSEGVKEISADRTVWAFNLVREMGGKVKDMYALLGEHDLLFIVDLPGIPEAIKASVALSKQTGITFTTSPAITGEEFDKLVT
jgi:uncharacterized protein with GYD domain